jgi:hypothetical protein
MLGFIGLAIGLLGVHFAQQAGRPGRLVGPSRR